MSASSAKILSCRAFSSGVISGSFCEVLVVETVLLSLLSVLVMSSVLGWRESWNETRPATA